MFLKLQNYINGEHISGWQGSGMVGEKGTIKGQHDEGSLW